MSDAERGDFGRFLKPALQRRLGALGLDVVYRRARGDHLYLEEAGEEVEVLDLVGGFGATLLGHNHPELVGALRRVLDTERPVLSQGSVRAEAARLARRLSDRVGKSTGRSYLVTLANSGAEAIEAALKHAELERRARIDTRVTRMQRTFAELEARLQTGTALLPEGFLADAAREAGLPPFQHLDELSIHLQGRLLELKERPPAALALEGGFHGKTAAASQLTHNPAFREPWRHLGPRVVFLPPGSPDDLDRAVQRERLSFLDLEIRDDGTAALVERPFVNVLGCFAEPIQGEGGVRALSDAFVETLRTGADAGGFPLVFDEIQSGMGRAGAFLASEAIGVRADYYTFGKSLGGGLVKISALLVDRERYVEDFDWVHSSTYAADDPSSAVANAVLDLLERDDEGILAKCREKGEYLMERLRRLREVYPDQLREVRGQGLFVGVELAPQDRSASPLLRVLTEQDQLGMFVCGHLLAEARIRVLPTLSSGRTLRLEPSALIGRAEIDRFCRALDGILAALRDADAHRLARHVAGAAAPSASEGGGARATARAAPAELAPVDGDAHVGFLGHFVEPGDLRDWDPALAPFPDPACERFLRRTRGTIEPFVAGRAVIRSVTGARVTGTMIALPFVGIQAEEALRAGEDEWLLSWIDEGIALARELGCTVLGFGGFTSIATRSCRTVHAPGLAITTGNALTAAAALEATFSAAERLSLERRRLGVVGAAGNIGRVLGEVAACRVDEVVLIGRPGAAGRLRSAAEALEGQVPTRIGASLDDLQECDLIISATNSARPVILPEHVSPDRPVVVCDVALPGDVDPRVRPARPAALVLEGGVIRAPLDQRLDFGGMALRPGELYGCFAETLLLGLEGIRESFSRGPLRSEQVHRARALAARHGFSIDEPVLP